MALMAKCKELKAQGGVRPAPAICCRRTCRAPTSGIAREVKTGPLHEGAPTGREGLKATPHGLTPTTKDEKYWARAGGVAHRTKPATEMPPFSARGAFSIGSKALPSWAVQWPERTFILEPSMLLFAVIDRFFLFLLF
jgi:hypothetical protein